MPKDSMICGKNINLRLVEEEDFRFIYDLRSKKEKTKFLSPLKGDLKTQLEWIKQYKKREQEGLEYYFCITSKQNESLGLVRLYDFKNESFCWGSWLIKEDAPKSTAIQSALLVYEFGFYKLGFTRSHFDVRKENEKVVAFHKRFGATIIREDEKDYFFTYDIKTYEKIKIKYERYL